MSIVRVGLIAPTLLLAAVALTGGCSTDMTNVVSRQNVSPDRVQQALEDGADPNEQDEYGLTPLALAIIENQDVEIVRVLIDAGADVNLPTTEGVTPLHRATNSDPAVVELLVEAGADVNARNASGELPIHNIARDGTLENAGALLRAGAEANAVDDSGRTPLDLALGRQFDPDSGMRITFAGNPEDRLGMARTLLEHGAYPQTGVHLPWAAKEDFDLDLTTLLLEFGADANWTDPDTGIHILFVELSSYSGGTEPAYGGPSPAIARVLLDHGADVNAVSRNGYTPLYAAIESGNLELIRLYLDRGADVQGGVEDRWSGITPLRYASGAGPQEPNPAVVELLLEYGADPTEPLACRTARNVEAFEGTALLDRLCAP